MKKFIMGLIVGIIIATTLSAGATPGNIKIFVNGKTLSSDKAFISEGVTMVPLRVVAEALDFDVKWEAETRTIIINSKITETAKQSLTLQDVTNLILPAVVLIETQGVVLGSGFFVTPDKVITNVHVIEEYSNNLTVAAGDGVKLKAQVLNNKPEWDLALLKVQGNFPHIANINSEVKSLDTVFSFPYNYQYPVVRGEVGAIIEKPHKDVGVTARTIHYNAPITPGSSGGPVVNEYGELIGVTYWGTGNNIAFAICASYVKKMLY